MSTDIETEAIRKAAEIDAGVIQWTDGPSDIRVPLLPRRHDLLVELATNPPTDEDELKQLELRMIHAPKNRRELRAQLRLLPSAARRLMGFGWNRNRPLVARHD